MVVVVVAALGVSAVRGGGAGSSFFAQEGRESRTKRLTRADRRRTGLVTQSLPDSIELSPDGGGRALGRHMAGLQGHDGLELLERA